MPPSTGAQALVQQLRLEGVDTVFGLPGAQIMGAFDALYHARDQIRLIQTRHEQGAAFMALGYAQASGRVGVALVVPGPGAYNAGAALGTAYATSNPVLLISGQIPSRSLGKGHGQLHEVDDQLQIFQPITKWSFRATDPEQIPRVVHEAMRHLKSGRTRPVELEIPPDILTAETRIELLEPEDYPPPEPEAAEIARAVELLRASDRPLLLAGGGTVLAGASKPLRELAERLQIPVTTTPEGKGILPEDHYLAAGVHYGSLWPEEIFRSSDLVLAVGTRLFSRTLRFGDSQKLIHVDIDPAVLGNTFPSQLAIRADAGRTLGALVKALEEAGETRPSRRREIEDHARRYARRIRDTAPEQTALIDGLRRRLKDDAVVVSGINILGLWAHLGYPARGPRTYLTTSYFGTLGYAFPAALGARIGAPRQQVVALCGDGGFLYSPQELATAMKYGIRVVAVILNNASYGSSEWHQICDYENRCIGTRLQNPDFVKLAEAFGARGLRATPDQFEERLEEALGWEGPVVLDVPLSNVMPPFLR